MRCTRILALSLTFALSLSLTNCVEFINRGYTRPLLQMAFARAAGQGDLLSMRLLLATNVDVNARDPARKCPLVAAAEGGHLSAISLLLDRGADVNWRDEHGWTALMYAVGAGQKGSVRLLISRGADVNVVGRYGSALEIAGGDGRDDLVHLLEQAGAESEDRLTVSGLLKKVGATR